MSRQLNEKQLWLLRMIFEEGIEDEIQGYAKDNATNISRWRDNKRKRLPSRLDRQITDGAIEAEPAVLQSAEPTRGDKGDEPSRDRRSKRKPKTT